MINKDILEVIESSYRRGYRSFLRQESIKNLKDLEYDKSYESFSKSKFYTDIEYSQYFFEEINSNIEYSKYISDSIDNLINYTEYLQTP